MSRERATAALDGAVTAELLPDLKALAEADSSLLLADLDCVDADGFGHIRDWLDASPERRVAFLTTRMDGFKYAAAADITGIFVAKPFLASELRSTVQKLLR